MFNRLGSTVDLISISAGSELVKLTFREWEKYLPDCLLLQKHTHVNAHTLKSRGCFK